ncbi:MAG: Ig-like domain-containing protein [Oscillospiraceae bacterium]|nr:Ig-like domain-containing protein [Oscillospiraceae bacterium]
MEEKVVCFYCGTVYSESEERCPLCGGTLREDNPQLPQPLERHTEEERKERKKEVKPAPKKQDDSVAKKGWLLAALLLLAMAVVILFWFILDMIGWLPGLEDRVKRNTTPTVVVNEECTTLTAEPISLSFDAAGKSRNLKITVNAHCKDSLYCNTKDPSVAEVSTDAITEETAESKSVIFTINSVSVGTTSLTVTCGNRSLSVPVYVGVEQVPVEDPNEEQEPTVNYVPELSRQEIKFTAEGDTVELKLANPIEGATVSWTSGDTSVVTVDANGVVTAVANGTTEITCTVQGAQSKVSVTCEFIEVTEPNNGAHLEITDATIKVGESFALYLYDSDGAHLDDIKYKIDDASICTVSNNRVKGLKSGTTKVRVIYNDTEYVCIVRVKK